MKTLKEMLTIDTDSLRELLNKKADVSGDSFWFFLPKDFDESKKRICLVAHIDTFHDDSSWYTGKPTSVTKKRVFHDEKAGIYFSPEGLGGDDRAGVYACLSLFHSMPEDKKPIVLLTDFEERGGDGAFAASYEGEDFLRGAGFFLEIDRRGGDQCVFYNREPKRFKKYIKSFGFHEAQGSFSDISILGGLMGLCGANVSAGFYDEHTKHEYLIETDLQRTVFRIKKMLWRYEGQRYENEKIDVEDIPFFGGYGSYTRPTRSHTHVSDSEDYHSTVDTLDCAYCGRYFKYTDLMYIDDVGRCPECGAIISGMR